MGWPQCNTTLEDMEITETPVWNDWTFHELGLWISAIFALIAMAISFLLIWLHAIHYSKPYEQRHIIRILFMIPVYAAVSFLSIKFYKHSIYFEVIRDCYEAFAIASFFSLLSAYISPTLHSQKEYFRTITPKPWIWPLPWMARCCPSIWRTPRSGLTWFNVIWTAIFQYCFIRVFMTVVACVTQIFDRYCLESLNPGFAHVWVIVIEATAVTIAMYCLIQFYIQIRNDIAEHKPLLKVSAIKLVIFLSFWQTIAISILTSTGAIKSNDKFQTPDIKIGIPCMLLCIEMALFAIFHIWAFSYRPYRLSSKEIHAETTPGEAPLRYLGGFLGIKAIVDSMNPWDMVKAVGRAAKWLFRDRKHRHKDVSYTLSKPNSQDSTEQIATLKPGMAPPHDHTFDQPTAYKPQAPRFNDEQGTSLLANPAQMGRSRTNDPSPYRYEGSPYRQNESPYRQNEPYGYQPRPPSPDGGDIGIGVATTTYDDRPHQINAHQAYQPYQQQSGVISYQQQENRGRSQMPHPQSLQPQRPPRDGNMF